MKTKRLLNHDWQFHVIAAADEAELRTAWRWELEREAGSGAKPWLRLSRKARQRFRDYEEAEKPPVRALPLDMVTEDADALRDGTPLALHSFEIDWSAGKAAIRAWFVKWARSKPHDKARQKWPGWTDKGGRKRQFLAWLVDLAAYRAANAGLSQREAANILAPLIKESGASGLKTYQGAWSKAKARTRQRVEAAKQRGKYLATILRDDLPQSPAS